MITTDTMVDTPAWGSSSEAVTPDGFAAAVLAVTARAKAALLEAASRIDTAATLVLAGEVELLGSDVHVMLAGNSGSATH
jgi:hypothetical protein